ncbi:MAG: chorismate mutase [Candidatus Margulisbacteria bacterium]|nr:chorismate mutase [Candidatus Margulisiibacteriota bacterium]
MAIRGIRGAITVDNNNKEEIIEATQQLLAEVVKSNQLKEEDIASIIFSTTADLDAEFPAAAARQMGLNETPLMCTKEIDVPGSLAKCIRILLHVNTSKKQKEMKHIYLRGAVTLRR